MRIWSFTVANGTGFMVGLAMFGAITFLPGESPAPQRPPYVDAVFARDDLKPAFVQAARLLL